MNGFPLAIAAFTLGVVGWLGARRALPTSSALDRLLGVGWAGGCLAAGVVGVPLVPLTIALLGGVVVSLLDAVGAMTFLTGLLLVRPWEMVGAVGALGALPRIFAVVTLVSVGLRWLVDPRAGLFVGRSTVWFAALITWFFIATLCAAGPTYLGSVEVGNFLPLTIVFVLIPSVVRDTVSTRRLAEVVVLAVAGAVGAAFFTPPVPLPGEGDFNRLSGAGLFGNSNDLAALIVIALSLLVVSRLRAGGKSVSWGSVVIAGVLLWGLWGTQSRGAVLALAAAGIVCVLGGRYRRWAPLLVPFVLVILGLFFALVKREEVDLKTSETSRWSYAIAGVRMARSHPLFGVGMENYPRLYEQYTPAFDEWGERTAHSSWILVLAETGFPGLLLFVGLYGSALRGAWGIRRVAPEYAVTLIAYGVTMSFLSHTYTLLPYLVTALAVGAVRSFRPTSERSITGASEMVGGEVCFSK